MSEPNPYEPPREPEPLTTGKVVKRSVGVAAVIVLTPPAMIVAIGISCTASTLRIGPIEGLLVSFGGPLLTLVALMVWAAALHRPGPKEPFTMPWRIGVLLATPIVVAVATAIGFGLAALVVDLTGRAAGGVTAPGVITG